MSTITEIEEAVATLPRTEQQALVKRLQKRLEEPKPERIMHGWKVPPPDVPLEELKRIHAIIETEFPILR